MLNGELLEFPKANYTEEDLARFRQEAWDWAVSEKDRFYPETKNINLKSLERHPHKYGAHLAIFADPENDSEALLRVFWPYDSKLIYHRLCNLKEIRSEHPELTYHYILNGRIPGVERLGKSWAIPEDAVKPTKRKSGPKPKQTTNRNP